MQRGQQRPLGLRRSVTSHRTGVIEFYRAKALLQESLASQMPTHACAACPDASSGTGVARVSRGSVAVVGTAVATVIAAAIAAPIVIV